jgi:hypothetical protein
LYSKEALSPGAAVFLSEQQCLLNIWSSKMPPSPLMVAKLNSRYVCGIFKPVHPCLVLKLAKVQIQKNIFFFLIQYGYQKAQNFMLI